MIELCLCCLIGVLNNNLSVYAVHQGLFVATKLSWQKITKSYQGVPPSEERMTAATVASVDKKVVRREDG